MSDGFIIRRGGGSGGGDSNADFKALVDRSITEVTADMLKGATSIGNSAFSNCINLTSVTIPNSVTSIGNNAFRYCNNLTSVTISNSVTIIGNFAFSSCDNLASIEIPNGVRVIGDQAFQDCYNNLESVTISSSITSIAFQAFYGCAELRSVTVKATTPPTLGGNVFKNTSANLVIYVPAESVDAYKASSGWSTYASKIQAIPSD